MGWGKRLIKGAIGAGIGFATGGPAGAAAGGVGGLLSGDSSAPASGSSNIEGRAGNLPDPIAVPKPLSQTASSLDESRGQSRSRIKKVYGYGG